MVNPGPYSGAPGEEPAPSGHPSSPPQPPSYGAPPPPPQYGAPAQPPYGAPTQPPYGAPAQPPYGAPAQPPYGAQGQPPYGAPGQPPYGAPPATGYPQPPYTGPMGPPGMPMSGVGQPGNLGDRFVARFIDGLIVGVVVVIFNFVLAVISNSWLLTGFISAVVTAALYLGYFAYFESSRGQTIGKQVMKLKVFGPDRVSNPTLEQAIRRNIYMGFGVLRIIPFIGGVLSGLAGIAAAIVIAVNINSDPQRQHWFDKFAGGTQVIKIG
jgi:uncharacterized RDD family membrane protein YckC